MSANSLFLKLLTIVVAVKPLYFSPNASDDRSSLEPLDEGWTSTDNDPQFIFDVTDDLNQGWYQVSVSIEADKWVYPWIYFDLGKGFNELEATKLFHIHNGRFEGTVYLHSAPVRIRFDPTDERGDFKTSDVELKHISRFEFSVFAAMKAWRLFVQDPLGNWGRIKRSGLSLLKGQNFVSINPKTEPQGEKDRYAVWQDLFGFQSERDTPFLLERIDSLKTKPGFSVIMPVYNTESDLLDKAIKSVVEQVYPHWQLCIANDKSTAPHIQEQLDSWASRDSRIKVVHRLENGHISEASNSALDLATQPWVAMLDHDDRLSKDALAEMAFAINNHPNGEVFYSDEDKIDIAGNRYGPHFKPSFSPELFRSMNYLNHLTVHKIENVRAVKGWKSEFVGSQDYDLNLRIWDLVKDDAKIIHIPKVLYHWLAIEGSTALAAGEKDYTVDAGLRALQDHLKRRDMNATATTIEGLPYLRVIPHLPKKIPSISFIIPTKDRADLVKNCISSIYMQDNYPDFEIILVDNNSEDPESLKYFDMLNDCGIARVLRYPHAFNYSAINNWAVAQSHGDIVALVNNDIEATSYGWVTEMAAWAWQDRVGCVGARLYYPDDTIQHAGVILGIGGVAGHGHKHYRRDDYGYFSRPRVLHNVSAVTAACLFVRREIFDAVGGLDEVGLKVAFNDVDFCLKVREAGYLNLYTPFAELYHYESISRGEEDNPEKIARFNSEIDTMLATLELFVG